MANLKKYSGRTLTSAETSTINLDNNDTNTTNNNDDTTNTTTTKLSVTDSDELCGWLSQVLDNKTKSIKVILSLLLSLLSLSLSLSLLLLLL